MAKIWIAREINAKKRSISKTITGTLLSIFKDLSDSELLAKCHHGETHNVNKSLNQELSRRNVQ